MPETSRYLTLIGRLVGEQFFEARQKAVEWCANNPTRLDATTKAALEILRTFELHDRAVPFVTIYAYADIPKGRVYTAIFDTEYPEIGTETVAKLCVGIFWERLPVISLGAGHHHLAVFEFPNGVPPVIESLPVWNERNINVPLASLGLCDYSIWQHIRESKRVT